MKKVSSKNKTNKPKRHDQCSSRRARAVTAAILLALTLLTNLSKSQKKGTKRTDKVLFIAEVIRHGSRAPSLVIQKREWITKTGPSELTQVGMRQSYNTGLNTRYRYPDFFINHPRMQLNSSQFKVYSSGIARTEESAMAHMMALLLNNKSTPSDLGIAFDDPRLAPPVEGGVDSLYYQPEDSSNFSTPLPHGYQSFSIYSVPYFQGGIFFEPYCRGLYEDRDELNLEAQKRVADYENSLNFKRLLKDVRKIFNKSSDYLGNLEPAEQCFRFADFAIQDLDNSLNPVLNPSTQGNQAIFEQLQRCYTAYVLNHSPQASKVLFTKIYNPIIEHMTPWAKSQTNKVSEDAEDPKETQDLVNDPAGTTDTPPIRYILLSGHDHTIMPILTTLNYTNFDCNKNDLLTGNFTNPKICPLNSPVASSLIWELITKEKDNYTKKYVKVSYNEEYLDWCQSGIKDEYGEFYCDWDTFLGYSSEHYIIPNLTDFCSTYEKDFGEDQTTLYYLTLVMVTVCVILFVLLVVAIMFYCRIKARIDNGNVDESFEDFHTVRFMNFCQFF